MQPDTTMLVVRQMMADWRHDVPATLTLECLDGAKQPEPLSAVRLDQGLTAAAGYVRGCAQTFTNFSETLKDKIPLNTIDGSLQDFFMRSGGDPNIFYLQGYWRLAADEALVIESDVPDCLFWNFQLDNYWMESMDYRYLQVALNKFSAKYTADGRLKLVIAARDPGTGNFIDTAGHTEGGMILRWVRAKTHPTPQCRVVKLDALRS
jgi:hypothetical protein